MFEKILEKILIQYFGKFIIGLDKNNLKLGVWSGNVVIEKVNINPEIIQLLELPLQLVNSQVGKLTLKIPWQKLSSAPIEIVLENIFITLNPLEQSEWQFGDEIVIQKKFQGLAEYCAKCIKKGIKSKQKDEKKDKGYLDKMEIKIMDNIQLKIVNIHIRYEGPYAWGITLESLNIFTCDQQWNKQFVDRTENKNQEVPIKKLFQLKNLAFYWDNRPEQNQMQYDKFMESRILKDEMQQSNFIISINADMKVVQNNPKEEQQPLNEIKLKLKQLNLQLQREQFQQMVHLFENFSLYSKLLWIQRKKAIGIDQNQINEYQKVFVVLFPIIMLEEGKVKTINSLKENQQKQFKDVLRSLEYSMLLDWGQISSKQIIKEIKLNKATKKKKDKESAWYKSNKKNPDEVFLNEEEILMIDKQIEEIFRREREKVSSDTRPHNSIKYEFIFDLSEGELKIINKQDGMQLKFMDIHLMFKSQEDESFESIFKIQNLSLDLINQGQLKKFCYKQDENSRIDQFLKIHFIRNISSDQDTSLMVQIDPLECDYDSLFIKRWQDFFNIENVNENIIQIAAQDTIHNVQNKGADSFDAMLNSDLRFNVQISIASPTIILQNWRLNLGNLLIQSEQGSKFYDCYTLQLSDVGLFNVNQDLIEKITFNFQVDVLKGAQKHHDKSKIIIQGQLPPIRLSLNEKIQKELLNIEDLIFPQQSDEEKLQKIIKQRSLIMRNKKFEGKIIRKDTYLWNNYYAILSGHFIYFYKKDNDIQWDDRLYLNDLEIVSHNDVIILQNQSKSTQFQLTQEWLCQIQQYLEQYKDVEVTIEDEAKIDKAILQIQLTLKQLNIKLDNDDGTLYELDINNVLYTTKKQTNSLELTLIMMDFSLVDYVHKFNGKQDFQYLIKNNSADDEFLNYKSKFENNKVTTKVTVGDIIVNWKPDTYLKLRELGMMNKIEKTLQIQNLQTDEAELLIQGQSQAEFRSQKIQQLLKDHDQYNCQDFREFNDILLTSKLLSENLEKLQNYFIKIDTKVVQDTTVIVKNVSVNIIHGWTHQHMGEVKVKNLKHQNQVTQIAMYLDGDIESVQLIDYLDNQPYTILDNQTGVNYKYAFYNKDYIKNQNETILNFSKLVINSADLIYQHQRFMRIINYIIWQVYLLIAQPNLLDQQQKQQIPILVFGSVEQIFNSFIQPQFLLQCYEISNIKVTLKQDYTCQDQITVLANKTIYSNKLFSDQKRLIKSDLNIPMWVNQTTINVKGLDVYLNSNKLSNNLDYQIIWDKLLFENEIKDLFQEIQLRNTMEIFSQISPAWIELNVQEYQILNKILAFNFSFNDGLDNLYIYNFEQVSKFVPVELRFMIHIPEAQVILKYDKPFVAVKAYELKIETFLTQELEVQLNVFAQNLLLQKTYVTQDQIDAQTVIGPIGSRQPLLQMQYESQEINVEKQFQIDFKHLTRTNLRDSQRPKIKGLEFQLDLALTQHMMEIMIDFDDCKVKLETKLIMDFLQYIDLPTTTFPPSPPKGFALVLNIKNSIIVLPGLQDTIVARGNLNLILEKTENKTSQKISLQEFEMFICQQKDLFKLSFNEINKRHLLMPCYAFISILDTIKNRQPIKQIDSALEALCFKLSYSDIDAVMAAVQYQKQQFQEDAQQNDIHIVLNFQINSVQLVLISIQEAPVPLFEFGVKHTQLTFTKIKQYIINVHSQIYASYFNVDIGVQEPIIEPLVLSLDHAYNSNGNPKIYTVLQINSKDLKLPMNINLTLNSIKALRMVMNQWKQSMKKVEKQHIIQWDRMPTTRPSLIYKEQEQQYDQILAISPYIVDNRTGYQIQTSVIDMTQKKVEIITVDNNQQLSVKYQENFFQSQIDRKRISIKIIDKQIDFKDINNLEFNKQDNQIIQVDWQAGMLKKYSQLLVQYESQDQSKVMKLTSNIAFYNFTNVNLEVKFLQRNIQQQKTILIRPDEHQYVPLGFETSLVQVKFQNQDILSDTCDLNKIILKNDTFGLITNRTQNLLLTVIKPVETNKPVQIILQTPFAIKNLLPYSINIHFDLDHPIRLDALKSIRPEQFSVQQTFKFNIKLPGFNMSSPICVDSRGTTKQSTNLRDYLGQQMTLDIVIIQKAIGFITILIDGGMTFQNTIGMQIYLYGRNYNKRDKEGRIDILQNNILHPEMQYVAGQPIYQITEEEDVNRLKGFIQVINPYDFIQFSFQEGRVDNRQGQFSAQFKIKDFIGRSTISIPIDEGYMDVIADVSVQKIDKQFDIVEKILVLQPRTVLINNLKQMITIQQDRVSKSMNITPEARIPFYWFKQQGTKYIKISTKESKSGCLSIENQGTITIPMRDSQGNLSQYISVSYREEDLTQYIIFEPMNDGQKPLYLLRNRLPFDIQFYQSEIQELNSNIKSYVQTGNEVSYSFDNPAFKKSLTIELYKNGIFFDVCKINLKNAEDQINQQLSDESQFYLDSRFSLVDRQIIITISQEEIKHITHNYDNMEQQIQIQIPQINLSLITQKPRKELLMISFKNIDFLVINDIIQTLQLRIEEFQIDNNFQLRCTYPVLATQQVIKQQQDQKIPFLNLIIKRAHKIQFLNYFQKVDLLIQPLVIKITEGTVQEIIEYFQLFKKLDTDTYTRPIQKWKTIKKLNQKLCFFQSIKIYPFGFIFSYQQIEQKQNQYFKSAAKQTINCDEVSLQLKGFEVSSTFITQGELTKQITASYKDNITLNVLKIMGSIDILGNPMGLIRSYGEGFKDLVEMPAQGFVQGPLEGGLGIAKGVGSLTKGVVSGTFNTVQKITGSVASGISQLSFDDQYLRERQIDNAKKAKTVFHGLGYGMKSLFVGVGEGIAGIVTQPYKGAESDGVEGFFKGISKGLAGVVIKPVVGVIDFASRTAEGVKNTATYFDDKASELRIRPPRVFYQRDQIYKNYVLQDAELNYILAKHYGELEMIDSFAFSRSNDKYSFAFIFTQKQLLLLEVSKRNVILEIQNHNIKGYEDIAHEFRVYLCNPKLKIMEKDRLERAKILSRNDMLIIQELDKNSQNYLKLRFSQIMQFIHDY